MEGGLRKKEDVEERERGTKREEREEETEEKRERKEEMSKLLSPYRKICRENMN